MRIENTSYLSCNYSGNKHKKHNTSFGKLLLDDNIPLDILQAISKNDELKLLVKKFHEIRLNVIATYTGLSDAPEIIDSLHLYAHNGGMRERIKTFFRSVKSNRNSSYPISVQLERLESGFAERVFNKYIMNNSSKNKEAKLKKETRNSIYAFNNSLKNPKKSLLERLLAIFNDY